MPRALVITGSREYPNRFQVMVTLRDTLLADDVILVGDARGVDHWAEAQARRMGCRVEPMAADWKRYGKPAGHIRNVAMLERLCKARQLGWEVGVIAFWDQQSPGTYDCMAEALKRDLDVYTVEPTERTEGVAAS